MMTQRFHFDAIVRFLLRSPRWMAETPFVGFLILLFFALLISSSVFYRYVFLARDARVESAIEESRFDRQTFQRIIQTWQELGRSFDQAGKKQIRNIFFLPQETKELTPTAN